MVLIAKGDFSRAAKRLDKRLAADPQHSEVLFLLAVLAAQTGNTKEALAWTQRALNSGLPAERFVAGPRELLRPLMSLAPVADLIKEQSGPLVHGPTLGSVTDHSAAFWLRTASESSVRVRARADGQPPVEARAQTVSSRDFTALVRIDGLVADTEYRYRIEVDGKDLGKEWSFRSFPQRGKASRFQVVFGGGSAYYPPYERMFDLMKQRRPLAFLQLGDNVYVDQPKIRAAQQYCYYRRQSSDPYRRLAAETCIAAIWDDHDFADDDSHGGPEIEVPAWKRPVWETFRNNWANPAFGGGEAQPGCWFEMSIADVDFFFIDGRYYRENPKNESPSMLGPVQKAWLLSRLAASKATFKVIASCVPFARGVKPGSKDPWDGHAEEREEIFSHIQTNRIEGVVLIAADRHRSDAWRISRPEAYDLYEFQSSRITNIHVHPVMKNSLWGYNADRSFGLLNFDTKAADPRVIFTAINSQGAPVGEQVVTLSQLSFR